MATETGNGFAEVIDRARELNFRYCWSLDKKHLWPIANRHLWRILSMYRGRQWSNVDQIEGVLVFCHAKETPR